MNSAWPREDSEEMANVDAEFDGMNLKINTSILNISLKDSSLLPMGFWIKSTGWEMVMDGILGPPIMSL